jgi:Pectate lyase superfamily protein
MVMRHLAIAALFIPSPALAGSDAPQSCNPPPDASVLVNVTETGAKGDGKTDDTAAIQAAIDKVAGSNGIVFLPDGIYMVAVGGKQGLNLKSDMTLKLSRGATIRAMPTKDGKYVLLRAGASNVWIIGGTLEGERSVAVNDRTTPGMCVQRWKKRTSRSGSEMSSTLPIADMLRMEINVR